MEPDDRAEPTREPTPEPPWAQRPEGRPARRVSLTREGIVDAALVVLDREGLDGFSMRAVAEELGTGAGSLYWHVRGKEELLNLMVDRVIGTLEVPGFWIPPDGRSRPRSSHGTCGGC